MRTNSAVFPATTICCLLAISTASMPPTQRTAASYSILGHDPATGEFGVAAASHAPLIGLNLEFLEPEAGAVVVHGGPHLELNRRVITALRDGLSASRAIQVGLIADPEREKRQVLAIARTGAAAFTGKSLEPHAAQRTGELFVAAGHRLTGEDVVGAMADAFTAASDGPLADRLLSALAAGRDAGGERGGAHSAALVVVGPGARFATRNRLVDLRVDFVSDDAVSALNRLRAQVDSVYGVERE